jgi:2-keto-4-pentenoate hydratase
MRHLLLAAVAALALAGTARAECASDTAVEALSRSLLANTPAQPLTGMTGLPDGQCAQDKLVRLLTQHWGRPVGYKVGLTNAAAQARFGVAHPVTGIIYEATVRTRSGGEVPARFGACPPWRPTSSCACATRASTRPAPTSRCCATSTR